MQKSKTNITIINCRKMPTKCKFLEYEKIPFPRMLIVQIVYIIINEHDHVVFTGGVNYWEVLIAIIALNLALQLATVTMAIILLVWRLHYTKHTVVAPLPATDGDSIKDGSEITTPEQEVPTKIRRLNDAVTAIGFFVVVLHLIKNILRPTM